MLGDRLCVLLVDDDEDSAEGLSALLAADGHEVRTAGDGPAALALAESFAPDVVLLDIGLPGVDGLEVARRLRELPATRASFVAALTGYDEPSHKARVRAAGCDAHLSKPVDVARVRALLLEERQRRQSASAGLAVPRPT